MLDGPITWDNYKQMLLGVLKWKPSEIRYTSITDVVCAIKGHIQNQRWEHYSNGKNLERLAWAIAAAFGSAKDVTIKDVFDYSIPKPSTPPVEETIATMANHFPVHAHNPGNT